MRQGKPLKWLTVYEDNLAHGLNHGLDCREEKNGFNQLKNSTLPWLVSLQQIGGVVYKKTNLNLAIEPRSVSESTY